MTLQIIIFGSESKETGITLRNPVGAPRGIRAVSALVSQNSGAPGPRAGSEGAGARDGGDALSLAGVYVVTEADFT